MSLSQALNQFAQNLGRYPRMNSSPWIDVMSRANASRRAAMRLRGLVLKAR